MEGKINFLRRRAEEYKAKRKPVPKEWAGLSTRGQDNLDLRKNVKYFKQQINLGETLLQRRKDLNREIKLKKGTKPKETPNNDLDREKSTIEAMIEEKKELHLSKQIAEAVKDYKQKVEKKKKKKRWIKKQSCG